MKIVIPMAGKGKRFDKYLMPKPLIEIDGKYMIEHVINYFPRTSEFIFICHEDHLMNTDLKKILKKISPSSTILSVSDCDLKGPAYTILKAFENIMDEEEVIVNYCDFIQVWDYNKFRESIQKNNPDGSIISFRGFHPSSLGDTYYAYLRTEGDIVKEIREKKSFSEDRKKDFASTGTYYFKSGAILKQYVKRLVSDSSLAINGEFYMSLPYEIMIRDGLKVTHSEVEKFICLGTPRDYELYRHWSEFFLNYSQNLITFDNINFNVTNIFPLAGEEFDFKGIGIDLPNFLIPVMNRTLIDYSLKSSPRGKKNIFIGLNEHKEYFNNLDIFNDKLSEVFYLNSRKKGGAQTIYELNNKINTSKPICISNATSILCYNEKQVNQLLEREDVDIILFSFSHHECVLRHPKKFHYAKIKNNIQVESIIEKNIISENPYFDQALTGTAIIKNPTDLFESIKEEIDKGEDKPLYFLSCISNLLKKRKVIIFEVDKFIPIRTITNFKEFLYWQDYFDELSYHPYSKMLQ